MPEEPIRSEQDHNGCGAEITGREKDNTSDPHDEEHGMP
jgi:hypothetical protein